MTKQSLAGIGILALCFLLGTQTGTMAQKDQKKDTKESKETKPASPVKRLTMDDLKTMLDTLAYEDLKEVKNAKGDLTALTIKIEGPKYTFYPQVEIAQDKLHIWVTAGLWTVSKPETIPVSATLGLLKASNFHWPCFFFFNEKESRFDSAMPIPNQDVQPRFLKSRIEFFIRALEATDKHWDPRKWA